MYVYVESSFILFTIIIMNLSVIVNKCQPNCRFLYVIYLYIYTTCIWGRRKKFYDCAKVSQFRY